MTDQTLADVVDERPPAGPNDVTRARAQMLAHHVIYVQGGHSTPEAEAERARAQLAQSPGSIDWVKMSDEVTAALREKLAGTDAGTAEDGSPADLFPGDLTTEEPDVASGVQLDLAKIRRYKVLREAQKVSEAEGKAYKEEADRLQDELVEMFAEAQLQNLNVDGKTVYLHRDVYAQWEAGMSMEEKKELLRAAGAGDLVTETVNGQTLNAWVRELTEDDDAPGLPEQLTDFLSAGERFSIRINAAGTRAKSKIHSKG